MLRNVACRSGEGKGESQCQGGLVDKAVKAELETVLVAWGFVPDGPQSPARGECLEEFVTGCGSTRRSKDFIITEVRATGLKSLSPVDCGFLGTGLIVEVLKQAGTWHVSSEVLKMSVNTGDSWSEQCFKVDGETDSAPAAFCLLKMTSLSWMERVVTEVGGGVGL